MSMRIQEVNSYKFSEEIIARKKDSIVTYKPGESILKNNFDTNMFWIIVEGVVKTYIETIKKKTVIINISKAKTPIGLRHFIASEKYTISASALTLVKLIPVNVQEYNELLKKNPNMIEYLLSALCYENKIFENRVIALSQKQLPGKLADFLVFLKDDIFKSNKFVLPFSRREISQYIGTTQESLIRTISEFDSDRIISTKGKHLTIISEDLLHKLSELG